MKTKIAVPRKKFIKENELSIPWQKKSGDLPVDIFKGTLPTTVILNKIGKPVYTHEGVSNYNTEDFIKNLIVITTTD